MHPSILVGWNRPDLGLYFPRHDASQEPAILVNQVARLQKRHRRCPVWGHERSYPLCREYVGFAPTRALVGKPVP